MAAHRLLQSRLGLAAHRLLHSRLRLTAHRLLHSRLGLAAHRLLHSRLGLTAHGLLAHCHSGLLLVSHHAVAHRPKILDLEILGFVLYHKVLPHGCLLRIRNGELAHVELAVILEG